MCSVRIVSPIEILVAETSLDKLLRLADVSQLAPVTLGKVSKADADEPDDEVHTHLMHSCSWYATICDGENPDEHCPCSPGHEGGGALLKFTSHTAEASTADKPTVPPGGPGLFHVKGLHLPPYIQHLWFHLVQRYGKQKAYGVAVGIVKKWQAGIAPGGKGGKVRHTHPDVRAAAGRNIAQWEEDKAKAHAQSAKHDSEHVKAAAPQPAAPDASSGAKPGKILPLPPPPKKTAPMMTAHRIHDMKSSLAHACERMDAARAAKDPALRKYEVLHIRNHLTKTLCAGHMLADNLRRNYRAEGRELDATMQVLGLAKSLSPVMKAATTAHLLETTLNECTHASRHADLMSKTEPPGEWEFNADHCQKHLGGALEHAVKLGIHICDNYPAEARLLTELDRMGEDAEAYIKAAAPAGWPSGQPYAKSFLSSQKEVISAPGAGKPQQLAYGQLKQEPSQTVSPSPPLPPKVDLPSPAELRKFAGEIKKMADDSDHHLAAAQMHLESAAEKMTTNPVSALASLRSAQMAIQQAWRWRVQHAIPRVAYVFSANTPPAEQSSQQQVWAKEQARIGEMQGAASKVAVFVDRVRRGYFGRMVGGMENQAAGGGLMGQPTARL